MISRTIKVVGLEHKRIAGGENLFCAWPWTGGIHNFENGEVVIAYTEMPSAYKTLDDVRHREDEARLVLCRTLDGGETWPEKLRSVVRDNRMPFDKWVKQGGNPRAMDMTGQDAMFLFWRSFSRDPWQTSDDRTIYRPVTFAMRSQDKGTHWEMPPVIVPHYQMDNISGGTNYVRLPDGTVLAAFGGYPYPPVGDELGTVRSVLYISGDQGLNWYLLSIIAYEKTGDFGCAYPALLLLPGGRLLCTVGYRAIRSYSGISTSWTSLTYSDDGGRTWAEPKRINYIGDQAKLCRLGDGRIVCMYGYRFVPFGIRGIVSEDEGNTWSDEFVIRDDGAGIDLGYPALTQLPDGRILTVYYFNVEDGTDTRTLSGGRRFIAASTFRLE